MGIKRKRFNELSANMTDFSVRAKVIQIYGPQPGKSGKQFQSLILRDDGCSTMRAVIFDADIPLYANVFHVNKEYDIVNAVVQMVPEKYKFGTHDYQMVLSSTTEVKEVDGMQQSGHDESFVIPLNRATEYIWKAGRIDIVGIVVHVSDMRTVCSRNISPPSNVRDILLIDKISKPICLSLWKKFAEDDGQQLLQQMQSLPIIKVTNVKATNFKGGSFSTTFCSQIIMDADVYFSTSLRAWYHQNSFTSLMVVSVYMNNLISHFFFKINDNIDHIEQIKSQCVNQDDHEVSQSKSTDLVPLQSLQDQEKNTSHWTKGRIEIPVDRDSFVYHTCSTCNKRCSSAYGEQFICHGNTDPHQAICQPRCVVEIQIRNDDYSISTTIFGDVAEGVLGKKASELAFMSAEAVRDYVETVSGSTSEQEYYILIYTSMVERHGNQQIRYTVRRIVQAEC